MRSLSLFCVISMGSFFLERIDRCIRDQQEIERMGSYKPRSGGIGKAVAKYSPELFEKIMNDEELRGVMKHLHYQELLEKPPEEWSTLTPLENYAIEFTPTWAGTGQQKVVTLNNGNLARTQHENTPWRKIKMEMGLIDEKCNCAECVAERAERAVMMEKEAEEKKLEDETEENEGEGDEEDEEVNEEEDEEEDEAENEEVDEEEDEEENDELCEEEDTEENEDLVEEENDAHVEVVVEDGSNESKVEMAAVDEVVKTKEDTNAPNANGNVEDALEEAMSIDRRESDVDDEDFQEFLKQLKEYSV